MGYYIDFSLEVSNVSQKDYARMKDEIRRIGVFTGGDMEHGYFGHAKWYALDEDMKLLSSRFPDVLFTLEGNGEEDLDIWKYYYKGGRVMHDGLVINITEIPFDEKKLEGIAVEDVGQKYSYEQQSGDVFNGT